MTVGVVRVTGKGKRINVRGECTNYENAREGDGGSREERAREKLIICLARPLGRPYLLMFADYVSTDQYFEVAFLFVWLQV